VNARRVGPVTVELVQGDVCDRPVEAIVNAANNHLWMGGGVAGAIKRRGGVGIEREAMAQGPIPAGSAVATGAGALAARYVIHAAVMGQDLRTDAGLIREATRAGRGVRSIAFTALGTGVGGFPSEACARVMLEAVRGFAPEAAALQTVEFVLFDRAGYDAFARVLGEE
jgi:O-acetyl-ADP-ribose deacetylase